MLHTFTGRPNLSVEGEGTETFAGTRASAGRGSGENEGGARDRRLDQASSVAFLGVESEAAC